MYFIIEFVKDPLAVSEELEEVKIDSVNENRIPKLV